MPNRMSLPIGTIHKLKLDALRITRLYQILGPLGTGRGKVGVRQLSEIKQQIGIAL